MAAPTTPADVKKSLANPEMAPYSITSSARSKID
jgi:hypothetical protein